MIYGIRHHIHYVVYVGIKNLKSVLSLMIHKVEDNTFELGLQFTSDEFCIGYHLCSETVIVL